MKGSPKKVKVFYRDPATADFGDWSWQVNFYRLMLEKNGYPVNEMYIQMTIRDGGVHAAKSRGIYNNIYLVTKQNQRCVHQRKLGMVESVKAFVLFEKCAHI
jgi:hypothetical protein